MSDNRVKYRMGDNGVNFRKEGCLWKLFTSPLLQLQLFATEVNLMFYALCLSVTECHGCLGSLLLEVSEYTN